MSTKEIFPVTKWQLLTFGAGSVGHWMAARRLKKQAVETGMFDEATSIDARYIRRQFPDFWDEHREFMLSNRRGFGYWVWKPFIILQTLKSLPEGWGLAYLDGGCILNNSPVALQRLNAYKAYALDNSVWATELVSESGKDFTNQTWCKADALRHFECPREMREMNQVQAGMLLMANNAITRQLAELWYRASVEDAYHYLDNSPSVEANAATFKEHRHDQALFNIFFRRMCLRGVPDETFYPGAWLSDGASYPIWCARWNYIPTFKPHGKLPFLARVETVHRIGLRKSFSLLLRRFLPQPETREKVFEH